MENSTSPQCLINVSPLISPNAGIECSLLPAFLSPFSYPSLFLSFFLFSSALTVIHHFLTPFFSGGGVGEVQWEKLLTLRLRLQ